jgi:HD-GYP domain-containing protein (c-di-GMP phosphodiesterase class II)
MTSDRPCLPSLPPASAILALIDGRGTQWDPTVVDAFVRHNAQIHETATRLLDSWDGTIASAGATAITRRLSVGSIPREGDGQAANTDVYSS